MVIVADWVLWANRCIGSRPSNSFETKLVRTERFYFPDPYVYINGCIVSHDIRTISRCSHSFSRTSQCQVCPQA